MSVFIGALNAKVWIIPYYILGTGFYCFYVMGGSACFPLGPRSQVKG